MDYDSSRHHLEALQTAKKRDDIKIKKVGASGQSCPLTPSALCNVHSVCHPLQAEEEMAAAQAVYQGINGELKEELPALFER